MTGQKIIHGKAEKKLKDFPDNFFDSCVTDPPYGLKFMNKQWDYDIPPVTTWRQVYRVLKPGAYILVACATRTQHRMACNIEDAGFEIRDVITWHYGSGFPKSMDISKAIDKAAGVEREKGKITSVTGARNKSTIDDRAGKDNRTFSNKEPVINYESIPATDAAKQWDGYGTALKPATEFWTLARKPLSEATIAQNVLKHGTGGLNIDAARVSFAGEEDKNSAAWGRGTNILGGNYVGAKHGNGKENIEANPKGRWPANLILSHHPDCVCVGSKKVKGTFTGNGDARVGENSKGAVTPIRRGTGVDRTDQDGLETVEAWQCVDGCPVKELDKQAPNVDAFAPVARGQNGSSRGIYGDFEQKGDNGRSFHDSGQRGGASRFFYCAKADSFERNKGCENLYWEKKKDRFFLISKSEYDLLPEQSRAAGNIHVTVKPIDFMRYLVKMITPKYGNVLDPFNGSGSTGIASKLELMNYTGIDMLLENIIISNARIDAWHPPKYIEQTLF